MARKKKQNPTEIAEGRIREATRCRATEIDLSGLELSVVPELLGQITGLQALDLRGNQLTALPEWLGQLTGLQTLVLSGNQLTALPESLGQLTGLQTLDLSGNQLTALPESLGQLVTLRQLYLHGNDRLSLPSELLGRQLVEVIFEKKEPAKPAAILDYYFRSRAGRPLNEAKLILVGRGGVGKTSLVSRLVSNNFDAKEKKTEGIQITDWDIKLHGQENVRLHVWDFGGQEIMHATHQFFLTERSLYVLVLNGREGGEDAEADYWLRLIESFGGNSPVIVVLNKIREHPFDLNRRALEQKYVGIREFVETDCEEGIGIDDLRRHIERETDRLDDLRVRFPTSWFAIKDSLGGMKTSFLSFDAYRAECARLGEGDAQAQDRLAGFLHLLGIALNFKDDPRLHDTHVLNPHWVTNGIYRILNAPKLAEQRGEIRVGDLAQILEGKDYPKTMHAFLLDLMRKFELCFPFLDEVGDRFLIAELLDKQEPAETADFKPEACLNFEYHYPVLPEGLIPRFIVRTQAMSSGLARWRSGVIVAFDGNRALVKADVQERKVVVSVSGPLRGRRNLLAIIRADLERIHGDITKLQPTAMVPVPGHPKVVIEYGKLLKFEEKGKPQIEEVIGDEILALDVRELLNGVDVVTTRGKGVPHAEAAPAVRLFISYAHKDESYRAELDAHLKLLQRIGLVQKWDDRLLKPGEEWKAGIDENLEQADIILLLVSADFINSDFCWDTEMDRALERHEVGEARVIPVIIRDVSWSKAKFAKLQALPREGKAVPLWADRDSAWKNVAEGIQNAAEEILVKRPRG